MKKFIPYLIFFLLSVVSCSEKQTVAKQERVTQIKDTMIKQDSTPRVAVPVSDKLVPKSFKDLNTLLQKFLTNKDVENLIDDDDGIFYIEDGPGATPVYKQLYSKYDLLTEEQYLLYFRDHHLFPQQFYFPEQSVPCELEQEGYYVLPVPEKNELLVPIYKIISAQNNEKPKPEILDKLEAIDASVSDILMVNAKGKNDESVILKFYIAKKEKAIKLIAIDARTCGA